MTTCINCTNKNHDKCLFDPPYNLCNCCTGHNYNMTINDEAQQIVGIDGGLEFV